MYGFHNTVVPENDMLEFNFSYLAVKSRKKLAPLEFRAYVGILL